MSNELDELEQAILGGNLVAASKKDLERFAVALTHSQAYAKFGDRQFPQICETVRLLLLLRISAESNSEATRISKIALFVSAFALIAGFIQAAAAIASLLGATH